MVHMIAPIPKLAELREAVRAHSEKRKPRWGFRIADDIVMELQAHPCALLGDSGEFEMNRHQGRKPVAVTSDGLQPALSHCNFTTVPV